MWENGFCVSWKNNNIKLDIYRRSHDWRMELAYYDPFLFIDVRHKTKFPSMYVNKSSIML